MPGNLIIVAAASGTGKTSLVRAVVEAMHDIQISVSFTTRDPRPADVEGVDYFFVDKAKFESMISENAFFEYADVYGDYKGTSKQWVKDKLAEGVDVMLEIDWQGAMNIKKLFPDAVTIFILPPSLETLRERIINRGQDSEAVIEQRMSHAVSDISHYKEFEYVVVNQDFDKAKAEIVGIIRADRFRLERRESELTPLIKSLQMS